MNEGFFYTQLNDIEPILKQLKLLKKRNKQRPPYKNYAASFFRGKSYRDIWQFSFDENLYDFLLDDDSILQFRYDKVSRLIVSYSYLNSPFRKLLSFEEFYNDRLREIDRLRETDEIKEEPDEYSILREYEFYIETNTLVKEHVSPIRYDYDHKLYVKGRHPASHIHFGHGNNIRVATQRILRPMSFILFILRQCYPDSWTNFLFKDEAETLCRNVREHPDQVHDDYWNELDEREMFLY